MTYGTTFSGIGGWELGLNACGWELQWQCECDPWCQRLLHRKFGVPIYPDIRSIIGESPTRVDVLCASPPCQPFSVAGRRGGASDNRNLWPPTLALVEHLKPSWFLCENVSNITNMGLALWIDDLEAIGYRSESFDIPSCACGLPTVERHLWIIAESGSQFVQRGSPQRLSQQSIVESQFSQRWPVGNGSTRQPPIPDLPASRLLRSRKGFPDFVDRIRGVGNAVPPQIPFAIGQTINQVEALTEHQ